MNLHDRGTDIARSSAAGSKTSGKRPLRSSHLLRNPFALLGATVRDDRRRIVELAEEKALELEDEVCQKARSQLTNPRMRVAAEVGWLPGVSPSRAKELISKLHSDAMLISSELDLPPLARANLLAESFEAIYPTDSTDYVADLIEEMAACVAEVSAGEVLREINEDRSISGLAEVQNIEFVEAELSERQRYYRNAIKEALDKLPSLRLVGVMTRVVDTATYGGTAHAPVLIDDLVDSYEVEADAFLQAEAHNIKCLCEAIQDVEELQPAMLKIILDKLEAIARNWGRVAQPIQMSAKARGTGNSLGREVAFTIRELAIEINNKHGMVEPSQRLTALIEDLFSELPEVVEQVRRDSEALAEIRENRKRSETEDEEWAREITYQADIGILLRDSLSISPAGIVWQGQRLGLDAITRLSWGGTRNSIGTTYTVKFGDDHSVREVKLRSGTVFRNFTDRLWKAVGVRLLLELLEELRGGGKLRFGDAIVRDDGITLTKRNLLGANQQVDCSWGQVHIWTADGAFYIGMKGNKKVYVELSYLYQMNTHILEQMIRMAFKRSGMVKLSDVLR